MIKIRTKRIKENEIEEYVSVDFRTKDTSLYEHLVLLGDLCNRIKDLGKFNNENLLKIVEMTIESGK